MNENQDLLDLCRLNQMEESVANSPDPERDSVLRLIEHKRRTLATKIINNAPQPAPEAMADHVERNTRHGVYPWTDTLPEIVEEE